MFFAKKSQLNFTRRIFSVRGVVFVLAALLCLSFVNAKNYDPIRRSVALQSDQAGEGGRMKSRFLRNVNAEVVDEHSEDYTVSEESDEYYYVAEDEGEPVGVISELMEKAAGEEDYKHAWRGYLQEKGPSEVIVEKEVEHEIEPLSDEIWALIMGSKTIHDTFDETVDLRRRVVEENTQQVKVTPVETTATEEVVEEETPDEGTEESVVEETIQIENEAESYEQLLELFNRPVLAMPTTNGTNEDGMLSFRPNGGNGSATIREGSQARFEIRKN